MKLKSSIILLIVFGTCIACKPTGVTIPTGTTANTVEALTTTRPPTKTTLPVPTSTSATVLTTPTPISQVEPVTFKTIDGVKLAGTLFGNGEPAIILAHQGTRGADQNTWHEFAQVLAARGFTALTLDFRGIGQSEGALDYAALDKDILAAVQYLREQGHEKIACLGASMGGTACIRAAIDDKLAGIATLGSTMMVSSGNGIRVSPDELASLALPKLFITAEKDKYTVVDHTTRMHEYAPEPKALHLLPGSEHGTDLFGTEAGDDLTAILLEFLENLPDIFPPSTTPTALIGRGLIVFYSERDGNAEIYTMDIASSDQRRLTFNQFEDTAPVWAPDGSQIAFISNRDDPDLATCFPECFYQLYVINADGSDEHRLIQTTFTTHHPDWHPDGTKISFDTEFNLQGDTYTVNSDGSNLQKLIEDGFWANWSPDGTQVAFASNRDGNVEIYLADADGSDQRRLTDNDRMDFFPAWSPDGERIAFMAGDGYQRQIYLINADGSGERQLTTSGRVNEDPSWSPDGKSIVFQSNRDGNFEIYMLNIKDTLINGEPQRLTDTRAGDYYPSWGPALSDKLGTMLIEKSEQTLQKITIENAKNLQLLQTLQIPGFEKNQKSQCSVAFNKEGSLLVGTCGKNSVPLWDIQSRQLIYSLYFSPGHIVSCDFKPDGNTIACGGFDEIITLWDSITGEKIGNFDGHAAPIWDLSFAPDGNSLASCSLGRARSGSNTGEIILWNISDDGPVWVNEAPHDCLSLSFNPTGDKLAYGALGGNVGILDAETGEILIELSDSYRNIADLAYSSSGQWLAAGSDDNTVYLWDASNFDLVAQLEGHADFVNGVSFNQDEALLATGSHDKTVGIWNLSQGKPIIFLTGHEDAVLRVAFSLDGTLIASISWDGTVRLWGVTGE